MNILAIVTAFAIGTAFGVVITINAFCYLINKVDIWIAPDRYIQKKIMKVRTEIMPKSKEEKIKHE